MKDWKKKGNNTMKDRRKKEWYIEGQGEKENYTLKTKRKKGYDILKDRRKKNDTLKGRCRTE